LTGVHQNASSLTRLDFDDYTSIKVVVNNDNTLSEKSDYNLYNCFNSNTSRAKVLVLLLKDKTDIYHCLPYYQALPWRLFSCPHYLNPKMKMALFTGLGPVPIKPNNFILG